MGKYPKFSIGVAGMIFFGDGDRTKKIKLFEESLVVIYKNLYRFIYSIADDSVLTDDAMQNTLLTAYKSFEGLRDHTKFKSWIYTIAKRETLSLIRINRREIPSEIIYEELPVENEKTSISEEILLKKELNETLVEAINLLRNEMRRVVNLRYYNGLSFEEISQVMNVNVNTIRIWHLRAKNHLEKFLKDRYSRTDN
jgi:RNA polymerase sigma-70 factor (ECF subfamily)